MASTAGRFDAITRYCHRYGPGRLPRADQTEIGAGYAAATGALGAAILFATGTAVGHAFGLTHVLAHPFWSMIGLVATAFVVPAAFVAAVAVWRSLGTSTPYFGAVAGALTVVSTYALSLAATFLALAAAGAAGDLAGAVADAAALTTLIGIVALAYTAWFTIPLGIVGGSVYERASDLDGADGGR